jgi:type I restriction enzyme S subunit
MNGYSIINKKPSIVCLNQRLITKLGANYYSIRKIEMVEKIINSTEDNKALGSLVKTKEKRMKPKGKDSIYIGLANINSDTGEIEVNTVDEANIEGTSVIIEAGDILFSKLRPNLNKVAICPKYIGNALGSTEFVVMESKIIDKYFLYSVLKSNVALKQVIDITTGSILPRIDSEDVLNILIPIPSPEIQKFIGDKVRRAEELREEAKRLKKETEGLIINKLGTINLEENRNYSSAFISSEKIVERIDSEYYHSKYLNIEDELNRKGFKVKKLGEVCTRIFNGRTYSTTDKERKYCNVGVGELGDWFVNKSKEKFINEKVDKKYCLKANSIIWGNAAHLAKYIGEKVNIVLEEETVIPTTEVTAIEPNEEAIDPYYLFIFMRTQWGYYQIQRTVKGMTAHSYPQDISNILVPIIDLTNEELEVLKNNVITSYKNELNAKQLIQQAKQDVEDLIEGNFEMSELNKDSSTESRC